MKKILTVFCSLTLALSLAACASGGDNRQPSNAAPAINVEQTSSGPAELSGIMEQGLAESSGQVPANSVVNSEHAKPVLAENHAAGRQIRITSEEGGGIVFQLNDSTAANRLYRQLPLSIWVEDYAGSEKIFYPPEALDTGDAPPAQGPAGTLAYYAPWGNVAIFYEECGGFGGLYELGEAVTGVGSIPALTGEVLIEAFDPPPASGEPADAESISRQTQLSPSPETAAPREPSAEMNHEENTAMKMNLRIGNSAFTATLEKNAAADALAALMKEAPVVIEMSDYAGFEKVGSLGTSLPASNSQTTTQSGDIVLYNGNQIVIFYGSNSWSYTRLGKIDDLTGWEEALGTGDVTVAFSLG